MPDTLDDKEWDLLLRRIKDGKCTPFLGAGVCHPPLPLGSHIASEWAQKHHYPLEDSNDLVRVAQFLAVDRRDAMFPKEEILNWFKNIKPPDFTNPDDPHRVLADLPLPIYITTNYDDFMIQALKSRNKDPKPELCRWNKRVKDQLKDKPSILKSGSVFAPTVANPVVFYLHGQTEVPESLVLTEDDYLDFLVNINKDPDLIPKKIQGVLGGTSLLFLGYGIKDWDFRVVFRSLVSYLEISTKRAHVSVQLAPGEGKISAEQKAKAQEYLDKYFGELNIRVYWGPCSEFAKDLRKKWEAYNRGT